MTLSRKDILDAVDLKTEEVQVPEWAGSVFVRGLNGLERDQFEALIVDFKASDKNHTVMTLDNIRAKLVVLSVVDEEGELLFQADDIAALGLKSASALQRVFEVAQRLSGLTKEDVAELAKNSGSVPSGALSLS